MDEPSFFKVDRKKILKSLGPERLKSTLRSMLAIRHFEIRAEAAYQQGNVGGFFHAYIGQEAIATACVDYLGKDHWYTTTYRCHALALLLGVSAKEAMAELYGKATGNAKGRGGSMHFFSDRMLGGFGIVGGHVPLAAGAAFSLKYQNQKGISVCFLGDGAVAQGAVHETLNMAALWELPCLFIVENNQWGMGTAVNKAISINPIAEKLAHTYGLKGYSVDGLDYFSCYGCFENACEEIIHQKKPVVIEAFTQRFRGHSISDPALYRTKEDLKKITENDPIDLFSLELIKGGILTTEEYELMSKEEKEKVLAAMEFASSSPYPNLACLEEDVFYISK